MLLEIRPNTFVNVNRIDAIIPSQEGSVGMDCLIFIQNQKMPVECNRKDLETIRSYYGGMA